MLRVHRWQVVLVAAICALGILFAIPNLVSRRALERLPAWLPHQQVNLGLDLQGGSHLVLEVEFAEVLRERLTALVDDVRVALRKARIGYTGLGVKGTAVVFRLTDPRNRERALTLVRERDSDVKIQSDEAGNFRLSLSAKAVEARKRATVAQSIEIVRRRIDETGTREPTIQRQGADRILVQLPGVGNPDRIKALLGKTAKLTFHLLDETTPVEAARRGRLPPGSVVLPGADQRTPGAAPRSYVVRKRVMLSGDRLVDARATFQDNEPVVSFRFDSVGAKKFGKITQANVGHPFAIVLDGKVISAPVIREPILGGTGVISGGFTVQEAQDLALLLRAGALPAPLKILEERTVGPGLGADSIRAGKIASVIGLVAVVAFMGAYYGFFGLVADIALILNLALIVGLLSILQATLTLPGIAGIVLTIGMAVDANVLIYERIREEARSGKTPFAAMDAGYRRSLSTILDANLTTLIAAVILYWIGTGPVRGFAVTLALGLATSMFTAFLVSRYILVAWFRRTRPKLLPL